MAQEEKHKKDLEAAKGWLAIAKENNNTIAIQILENFFTELRESEDERIRQNLYKLICAEICIGTFEKYDLTLDSVLDWLEKQDEQKPADKYEPMSLDEAIEHCKGKSCGNNACALEHQQLANWLIELKELKEQKPAEWREEDENILNDIIVFTSGYADKRVVKEWVSFLKSLTPRQRQEWSEEDEKMYQSIIDDTVQENQLDNNQIDWLKSLRDKTQLQPQQEWSEDDEEKLRDVIRLVEQGAPVRSIRDHYTDWLKSLKPSHWKPSEKQLEALNWVAYNYALMDKGTEEKLQSLYNDLKNL